MTGVNLTDAEALLLELVHLGVLSIDAQGCIWRHARRTHHGYWASLKPPRRADVPRTHGYRVVRVRFEGRGYMAQAHRLVYLAQVGAIPPQHQIDHLFGNKADNRPAMLAPKTPGDNQRHAYRVLGRLPQLGERNGRAKLTTAQVRAIKGHLQAGYMGPTMLARMYGVDAALIRQIAKGEVWAHVTLER